MGRAIERVTPDPSMIAPREQKLSGPDNSLTREVFPKMHLGLALKSELRLLLAV